MPKPLFNFDFSRRVALDTNVLLNSAFVESGLAHLCVEFLRRKGTPIYVPQVTEQEALNIARRVGIGSALGTHPQQKLAAYVANNGFLFSPPPVGPVVPRVNRTDEPIARSCIGLEAVLLTDDIDLICECRGEGISATQPWEVARSYSGSGALPDLLKIVRYLPPANGRGYLFARVIPGDWANTRAMQPFTVAHISDLCSLKYDNSDKAWAFNLAGAGSITVKTTVSPGRHYAVCGQFSSGGNSTLLSIRAAEIGSSVFSAKQTFAARPNDSVNAMMTIGNTQEATEHWNGYIKELTVSDGLVGSSAFKQIARTEDLSPNPLDGDKLSVALARQRLIIA